MQYQTALWSLAGRTKNRGYRNCTHLSPKKYFCLSSLSDNAWQHVWTSSQTWKYINNGYEILTFTITGQVQQKTKWYFPYFPRTQALTFHANCCLGSHLHKCQSLFSGKNKKNISKCHSADSAEDKLVLFFFFSKKNRLWHFKQMVSLGDH